MIRLLGYSLGSLLLVGGTLHFFNPSLGFRLLEGRLRSYLPRFFSEAETELSHLSDRTLRYVDSWEIVMGSLLLLLASRARD